MKLEELRDKIEAVEEEMYRLNLNHPYLNEKEKVEMSKLANTRDELLDELDRHEYIYIEAILNEHNYKSYLDRKLWHRSRPHPFLNMEEAKEAIARKQEADRSAYDKELYSLKIKKSQAK